MKLSLDCQYDGNTAKCNIMDGENVVGKVNYQKSKSPSSFRRSISFQSSIGGIQSSDVQHFQKSQRESIQVLENQLNQLKKEMEQSFSW